MASSCYLFPLIFPCYLYVLSSVCPCYRINFFPSYLHTLLYSLHILFPPYCLPSLSPPPSRQYNSPTPFTSVSTTHGRHAPPPFPYPSLPPPGTLRLQDVKARASPEVTSLQRLEVVTPACSRRYYD